MELSGLVGWVTRDGVPKLDWEKCGRTQTIRVHFLCSELLRRSDNRDTNRSTWFRTRAEASELLANTWNDGSAQWVECAISDWENVAKFEKANQPKAFAHAIFSASRLCENEKKYSHPIQSPDIVHP